ncbi:MAG: hypothetical protein RR162_00125 [Oscillospiraceae bacterium]
MRYSYIKGSKNTAEAIEFDVTKTNGDHITTCVVNISMLLAGVKTFPCGNGDDVTLKNKERLGMLNFLKEERDKIKLNGLKKTYKGWDDSGIPTFNEYVELGDEVDDEIVDYFANCVPPRTYRSDLVQCGEPYSHEYDTVGNCRATYSTFIKKNDGKWYFVGECFANGIENRREKTSRIDRLTEIIIKEMEERK